MAGFANSDAACGRDARTQGPLPAPQADGGSKDWYFIGLYEWMWRDDGLGLRPGAELMVYAAIYSASAHGGGVFVATIRSVAFVLGYPRETVSRTMGSLLKRGLIWVVGEVRDERGQNPQRCYAVSRQVIDLTQSSIDAICLERAIWPMQAATRSMTSSRGTSQTRAANRNVKGARGMAHRPSRSNERPAVVSGCDKTSHGGCDETSHGCGDELPCDESSHAGCDETSRPTGYRAQEQGSQPAETALFNIEGTRCDKTSHAACDETSHGCGDELPRDETSHAGCDETSQRGCDETSHPMVCHAQEQCSQPAETGVFNIEGQGCDKTSHAGCDETSHVTKHHTPEQGVQPAETGVFDNSLISTNHLSFLSTLSVDQGESDQVEEEQKGEGDRPLTEAEEDAFESLLRASIRPVGAKYVDDNRAEFTRLICSGVSSDLILQAYSDYARYQREQADAGRPMRCMHLLTWLRQNPNKNIQYLLNAQDDGWVASHRGAVSAASGRGKQKVTERRERVFGTTAKGKYSHQEPRLDRCIDRNTVVWYVVDERGGRLVQGSRGVTDRDDARRLYDAMYEEETTGRG